MQARKYLTPQKRLTVRDHERLRASLDAVAHVDDLARDLLFQG